MPRKKKPPLSFVEKMKKIANARLPDEAAGVISSSGNDEDSERMDAINIRVRKILHITEQKKKRQGRMLFFVMYDIESNKVRTLVHKYLKKQGCTPVQRSIFLADTSVEIYEKIKTDLAEVQAAYDNEDSIIVLPIATDYLRMMKIIGQKIEIDVITHSRNTLFF